MSRNEQVAAQGRGPVCGRFYAPPPPADYRYCYLPQGHKPPCVFTSRQAEASAATVRCPDCWNGKVIPCAVGCRSWDECCGKNLHGPCERCGGTGVLPRVAA